MARLSARLDHYYSDPAVIKWLDAHDEKDDMKLFQEELGVAKKTRGVSKRKRKTPSISELETSNRWPFRQSDEEWGDDDMWVKAQVVGAHQDYNFASVEAAKDLLHDHPSGGNTIGNDGCLLTCLAMVVRLLQPTSGCTPRSLNRQAKRMLYYTEAGISMVPLYADLVGDVTKGNVQACAQEQYFSGERQWRTTKTYASGCTVLRGYRALSANQRRDFVVMLKLGTHDDTFASHYVLVDPENAGSVDDKDVALLDPVQPSRKRVKPWMLSDSYRYLSDGEIGREWRRHNISPLQLSGVWVFGRWKHAHQHSLAAVLFESIVRQETILRARSK